MFSGKVANAARTRTCLAQRFHAGLISQVPGGNSDPLPAAFKVRVIYVHLGAAE